MSTQTDVDAARRFLLDDARLLERHRFAVLFEGAPARRVLDALRPYRTEDGGWGHALEPDLRGPDSQVSAAMSALEVLAELGPDADPEVVRLAGETADWLAGVALPDGRVPHVLPSAADHPAAPWMQPNDGSMLTFPIVAHLLELGVEHPWLGPAAAWCRQQAEGEGLAGYTVKFAVMFLDAVARSGTDTGWAGSAVERLRPALRPDGTIPVEGGLDDEVLRPLVVSPHPGAPSRALYTDEQITAELDRLQAAQQDDGGWDFEFLHWSPGQVVEWRGLVTLDALVVLRRHGRI